MEPRRPRFDVRQLRAAIRETYTDVALQTEGCTFHFLSGRPLAQRLGYPEASLAGLPARAVDAFAGVGNPFAAGPIGRGETVLDVGSGGGMDALIAARMVGPEGRVVGVDMTEAMVEAAAAHAALKGFEHVRFVRGLAEALPLPDASVDVVISNGVINLCPDKPAVFAELFRVLRPGGRLQIADTLLLRPVPAASVDLVHLWTDCVAGGMLAEDYAALLADAGFVQVEVLGGYDTFRGAPIQANAEKFGARGHDVCGRKPGA